MLFLFIFIRKNLESHRSRESESAGRGLRKQGQKKGFWSLGRRTRKTHLGKEGDGRSEQALKSSCR